MSCMDMRNAFEAWATTEFRAGDMKRMPSGEYSDADDRLAWRVWQAATRAAVPAWQTIETAPKDGTNVLLLNRAGNMACGMWMESRGLGTGWFLRGGGGPDLFFNDHYGPTHWMPLPAAPEVES
jgi:hypothetical protein